MYDVFDSCYATIDGRNSSGSYLTLDNGEPAFTFHICNLRAGTRVLCTIIRESFNQKRKLVAVDSIIEEVVY